ncbi:thermonuclease family protein [Nodosilinea sp. FACHB-131]|uniref:thermonuclease family protein n=1 Tax=Cyanophyceae TaxID=3028117 RepID=UPI00168A2F3E|nr:thermonuclease family protein [Nodosilinea sp. FACHB-131]MBD1876991.1 thermonuclease family protein [Nodosilinea sp. FACHB-131]
MKVWQCLGLAVGLGAIASGCSGTVAIPQDQEPVTGSRASQNLPTATVVSVGDGDTLQMNYQGQSTTVRFACIDAPETTQTPWGPAATERLRQLTPRGSTIQFREADTDRYGRMVAEVYANGQNMNLQMVSEGHAAVYTQFLSSCPDTDDALLAAEAQAQQQQLNFWNQSNPVMPWDYRRNNR